MKKISLSLVDFAQPAPQYGSIEVQGGVLDSALLGQEIHRQVQTERSVRSPQFSSEVVVAHEFVSDKYVFKVAGRMDGFYQGPVPRILEVKSAASLPDLARSVRDPRHPYVLQLQTYGYIHWLQKGILPELELFLVSHRGGQSESQMLSLDLPLYEAWLKRRLDELRDQADRMAKHMARRRRAATELKFPFSSMRSGQQELMTETSRSAAAGGRLLVQAPTGMGKTVGVLFPNLQDALARGQRVIYVTPKNSQHAVAEEAVQRLEEVGSKIRTLTITAKSKICLKEKVLCNPKYCEFAKDHYEKVASQGVHERLRRKRRLTARTFRKVAQDCQVCPFELQLDMAVESDVVICDYNYAFAPRASFGRLSSNGLGQKGKPNLVVDEAHHLPTRAMSYYSPRISRSELLQLRSQCADDRAVAALFDQALLALQACCPKDGLPSGKAASVPPSYQAFLALEQNLRDELQRSEPDRSATEALLQLYFLCVEMVAALQLIEVENRKEFVITYSEQGGDAVLQVSCCDAAEMLAPIYSNYAAVTAFSATLKPFDYYARLAGLAEARMAEFASPFPEDRRKLLLIPQISSKFSTRSQNYPRIAEAITRLTALRLGNYLAFFPSFEFMRQVASRLLTPAGFSVIQQERGWVANDVTKLQDSLREPGSARIVLGVQGGVLAEGVDYPGEMVIGAFVVGAPLPNFDFQREQMREYYEEKYGAGFDYAYTYPAMSKAVQAAGRVIRTETDCGLIVLMDSRFAEETFSKAMPQDWFCKSPREMISAAILTDVREFWQRVQPD